VNTKNPNRLPLLLIAAEEDRTIVPSLVRATYGTQRRTPSVTTFKSFLGRSHFLMAEPAREEVAAYAIQWASEHARYIELNSSQDGIDYGPDVAVRN
jgi:alpha-beta hydrolase superfamily lysophospholipase